WLAERLIRQIGYDGNPDKRVLDPSCGSGTFLSLCIRKAFDYADRHLVRPEELVKKLLANIVGFDLNPLAVIAARTNFLLSLGTLIKKAPCIEIPVYFCDSILTPAEYTQEGELKIGGRDRHVDTSEGRFSFPSVIIEKNTIEVVCALIEESVQVGRTKAQFLDKLRAAVGPLDPDAEKLLTEVFVRIVKLNADGRNGIWARFLKNQFAPIFVGKHRFDFVIGNPPWVNWQSLSDSYRAKTWKLWENYGLFSLSGQAARLGGGKKDLAMLFTYACLDNYVKDNGRLGFIITQTLFKTKGAGDGFRRFQLGHGAHFQVRQVDDLSDFQPFEGATNRTAIVTFQKGRPTKYPVEYDYWRKKANQSVSLDDSLDEVLEKIKTKRWSAQPINPAEPQSPWITARSKALTAIHKAIGASAYRAYAGSCTWANGVYWMEVTGKNTAGQVVARNLSDVGKLEGIEQVEVALEPDLLYPLVRGRDVQRWRSQSSACLLNVQDPKKRQGYDEQWLKTKYAETYKYLLKFEKLLRQRSGFRKYFCDERGKPFAPFYSLYNIGDYTLAPYKVCWREQAEFFTCAVITNDKVAGKGKVVIPDHKLMFVPLHDKDEAHYACAMLNSCISVLVVKSYGVETQTSTHVLKYLRLPKYDAQDKRHQRLAVLSATAHQIPAAEIDPKRLAMIETEIDETAAAVWDISNTELRDIQSSLADLR
ncbi:MAG: SAM-dependent DNA methyltransferase, partial [Kiritimatiellae bacterium]|nr:SAM-dependent DNA methyltransferase [Kiritimatiellia bacterium]